LSGIIIYKSKYGSTKQFSEWLKEEMGWDLCEASDLPSNLESYKTIVIGNSIHGGELSLKKWIIRNWDSIKEKNVVVMLTSGTGDPRFIQKTFEKSLPEEIRKKIALCPVGGRYLFPRMSVFDRTAIKVVAFFKKQPELKKGMLTERDNVNRDNLKEIVEFLKNTTC
jgi:menaquinone-dependent protoporphyrinogen IX oxidase